MAAEGAKVVVNDPGVAIDGTGFDKAPADEVVEAIRSHGGTAVANYDTVATVEGGESIIKTCVDTFGRIDILVNNAGILRDRMIFNMSEEEWDAVIAVHLKGHFACTKPAAVLMRQQRYGRIVNFSSISGLRGNAGQANYGAAKAGIAGFTRVVARDLGRYGVTCNAIAPGGHHPHDRHRPGSSGQSRQARANPGLRRRPQEMAPEHIAPMTVYLCHRRRVEHQRPDLPRGRRHGIPGPPRDARPTITKNGKWTLEELAQLVPQYLMHGIAEPGAATSRPGHPGASGQDQGVANQGDHIQISGRRT